MLNLISALWWTPQDPVWLCRECGHVRNRLSWLTAWAVGQGWTVQCNRGHTMHTARYLTPADLNRTFGEAS